MEYPEPEPVVEPEPGPELGNLKASTSYLLISSYDFSGALTVFAGDLVISVDDRSVAREAHVCHVSGSH